MHTIRYKGCVAQQDNKTGVVCVYKDGHLVAFHPCDKRLSGKELRGQINRYLTDTNVGNIGGDSDG